MRGLAIGIVALMALQVPRVAGAQASPAPEATRSTTSAADWRRSGGPLLFGGSLYYPSGPTVFFDGSIMVRSGSFDGVPIYIDATREPSNVVYVPVAGGQMRPYARSRADQIADTVVPTPAVSPVPPESETPVTTAGLGAPAPDASQILPPNSIQMPRFA